MAYMIIVAKYLWLLPLTAAYQHLVDKLNWTENFYRNCEWLETYFALATHLPVFWKRGWWWQCGQERLTVSGQIFLQQGAHVAPTVPRSCFIHKLCCALVISLTATIKNVWRWQGGFEGRGKAQQALTTRSLLDLLFVDYWLLGGQRNWRSNITTEFS